MKNDKTIFTHQAGRLVAMYETVEPFAGASRQFERRRELLSVRFELSMGHAHEINFQAIRAEIFDFPANIPTTRRPITRCRKLTQDDFRLRWRERRHCLFQPAFCAQFLLRDLENSIVDDAIEGKVFVHQPGANIFVEHLLEPAGHDGQISR